MSIHEIITEIGLACSLAAIVCQPTSVRAETAEDRFNVRDFGAIGDGVSNDSKAFQKAAQAAMEHGSAAIIHIPPGDYALADITEAVANWRYPLAEGIPLASTKIHERGHWTFTGAKDLSIEADPGARLLFQNPSEAGLVFLQCRNVHVQGLSVDYDPLPFTQGTVRVIDRQRNVFEVSTDPGFPLPEAEHFSGRKTKLQARRFYLMDADTGHHIPDIPPFDIDRIEKTDDGFSLFSRRVIRKEWEGQRFIMIARTPRHAFRMIDTGGCVFEDITIYSAPAQAFNEMTGPGGNRYIRCRILAGEGRMMSVNADGLFSKRMRTGPQLLDCRFEKTDDDGANIGSSYLRALAVKDDHTLLVDLISNHLFEPGDRLSLVDGLTGTTRQEANVISCRIVRWRERLALELTTDNPLQVTHTVDSLDGPTEYGPPTKNKGVTDKQNVPDLLLNQNTLGAGLLVRGCVFKESRVRGLRLYTRSARIENNRFETLTKPAINIGQSLSWFEGPGGEDITVTGNTFSRIRATSVYIGDFSVKIGPLALRDNRRIQIENNRFEEYGGPFADSPEYKKALLSTAIIVRNAENVSVRGNVFTPSALAPDLPPIIIDAESTSDIRVSDNRTLTEEPLK